MKAGERLIVALDVPSAAEAERLVTLLAGRVGLFKVGSQLFTAAGPDLLRSLRRRELGVFLDLKFHDIPNTVAHAVRAARELGASLTDVHALAGRAALEAALRELAGSPTRLLAITILTSHDEATLEELGLRGPMREAVRRLAILARSCGLDGVVASPQEIGLIRESCGEGFLIVTPGIRPTGSPAGDQARLTTPAAAIAAGADYLVVGRPITEAADPAAAADAIVAEIEGALEHSRRPSSSVRRQD